MGHCMKFKGLLLIGLFLIFLSLSACTSSPGGRTATENNTPTAASILTTHSPPAATATPGTIAQRSQSGSFFAINEVGLGPEGFVALTNFTDVPASLGGLFLCQGSACFGLPEVVVDAGETVRIAAGDGTGIEGVVARRATIGELRPSDGEIALYASQVLDDPQAMSVYFQWGSTPHDLTQVAIDAGLWVQGGYGPSSQNATRLFKVPESSLWLFEAP